jgi:hypothetical protein
MSGTCQAFKWAVNCAKADPANQNKLLLVPDLGQMKDQYTGLPLVVVRLKMVLEALRSSALIGCNPFLFTPPTPTSICISKRYAQG